MNLNKKIFNNVLTIIASTLIVVITIFATSFLSRPASGKENINLGNKYIEELNYDKAVSAYQNALDAEPTNKEAMIGLARAYKETNQTEFALEIINAEQTKYIDPTAEDIRLDIYIKNKELEKAIVLVNRIVTQTDDAQLLKTIDELLLQLLSRPALSGEGKFHKAQISNGNVLTQGQNTVGQLGVAAGINDVLHNVQTDIDAEFTQEAKSVFCTQYNTFVVTRAGDVYAAGSNQTGIIGSNNFNFQPIAGWQKVNGASNISRIKGNNSSSIFLDTQGAVYMSGYYNNYNYGVMSKIDELDKIIQIECEDDIYYALSTDGTLFYCTQNNYSQEDQQKAVWIALAKNIVMFSVDSSTKNVMYLTFDNKIVNSLLSSSSLPFNQEKPGVYDPDFDVKRFGAYGNVIIIQKSDNTIVKYSNGNEVLIDVPQDKIVQHITVKENSEIIQFEDGTFIDVKGTN